MGDVSFEIKKNVVSISSDTVGWNLELNLISWNGAKPKYDLRKWNEDHSKSGKGLTMSEDEAILLFQKYRDIIKSLTGEDVERLKDDTCECKDITLPFKD